MCLYIDRAATQALKDKCKKNKKPWVMFYKKYEVVWGCVYAPFQGNRISLRTNEVVAEGFTSKFSIRTMGVVNGGAIHGCIKPGYLNIYPDEILIRCWGHIKDLVAVGRNRDIAFTKMYIHWDDYEKLVEKYLPGYEVVEDE